MDRDIPISERRRKIISRWLGGLGALALALLGLVFFTGMLAPTLERSRIRTARIVRGPIEAVVIASGTVEPASERVISSPISGRILRVLRSPGALLEVGDAILELDTGTAQLALERLDEGIAQAEGRRLELELELSEALIDLEGRREVAALEVEAFQHRLTRERELFTSGLVAETALRETETQLEKAEISARQLEEKIENARRSTAARLEGLASELRTLERERAEAARALERASTRAERSGVLTWVVEEEGAAVREGEPLARIADLERFRVEASVSDVHASRLAAGQRVHLPLSDEASLGGRVARVQPAIDAGVLRFEVELDEPSHPLLRANLRLDVLVVTQSRQNTLLLPKGPWSGGGREQEVFVVEGDRAFRRQVYLGLIGWEHVEVESGLDEGEEVVLSDVREKLHLEEIEIR